MVLEYKVARELFESMIEGKNRTTDNKRILLETIQEQALIIYQNGLLSNIKLLVRSQKYPTLQAAIATTHAEEKTLKPTTSKTKNYANRDKGEQKFS